MNASRTVRVVCAALVGVCAGAWTWARAGAIEPSLDIKVVREVRTEMFDVWDVNITVRGGEPIDEIRLEAASGPVHVITAQGIQGLKSGYKTTFRMQLDDGRTQKGVVRLVQTARVSRTYEVPLEETR
jgi:hypothetical protein